MRGFGQGSRNDIDDFESQGFIERVDDDRVEFDFHTIYGSVVDLVRPADVRWTADLLNRVTDEQWDDAFGPPATPRDPGAVHPEDQSQDC